MKWNYLSEQEAKMEPKLVDLQIVLGLEYCKTKKDVLELLQDVRQHERTLNGGSIFSCKNIKEPGGDATFGDYIRYKDKFKKVPEEEQQKIIGYANILLIGLTENVNRDDMVYIVELLEDSCKRYIKEVKKWQKKIVKR